MKLKIGDRVKVISKVKVNKALFKEGGAKIKVGMTGTVKGLMQNNVGIEFNNYVSGHNGSWGGKDGHCWWVEDKCLEKIEEMDTETKEEAEEMKKEVIEETKTETMEQKILEALREEIGVKVGEEFDVYENGKKQWMCKFEENGFYRKVNDEFQESGLWKSIIGDFGGYRFKRKPFVPQNGEKYWHLGIRYSLKGNQYLDVLENVWGSLLFDYGMLALGNVFRSKEEALKGEDKLLERLKKLKRGE